MKAVFFLGAGLLASLAGLALPAQAQAQTWESPYAVANLRRLALTPELDGVIRGGEWEPLATAGNATTYLQWEPGWIYWAAEAPANEDIVFSLDSLADGWTTGPDNFEIRIGWRGPNITFAVRRLNNQPNGATAWQSGQIPPDMIQFEARRSGGRWTMEARLMLPGPLAPAEGKTMGVRVDGQVPGAIDERIGPRQMANVRLSLDTHVGLPEGLQWSPRFVNRNMVPQDGFAVDYTLTRDPNGARPDRFAFRAEGIGIDDLGKFEYPIEPFDNRNRTMFGVKSPIRPEAKTGWRIVRAEITGPDNLKFMVRSSVRIAPLLDIIASPIPALKKSTRPQRIRGVVDLQSNGTQRVQGVVTYRLPEGFRMLRGDESKFTIYHARAKAGTRYEIEAPAGASGDFVIGVIVQVGDQRFVQSIPIFIEDPV